MKGMMNPKNKVYRWMLVFFIIFNVLPNNTRALTITDGTEYGRDVYVVTWTDNDGQQRMVAITKASGGKYIGTSSHITYYNTSGQLVDIVPNEPYGSEWNASFGASVHHGASGTSPGSSGSGLSIQVLYEGDHHAIIQWSFTLDNTPGTITYFFMDGLDYFQWTHTVHSENGTMPGDCRGPYCTMHWDGQSSFGVADGLEYAANGYYSMPNITSATTNLVQGNWTSTGRISAAEPMGTTDIPFVREWDNGYEIGYVQSQTYQQQLAGDPTWSHSANLGNSGTQMDGSNNWQADFQMNFYDGAKKITWGVPHGYMNATPQNADVNGVYRDGTKNGWGQYSLSIIMDEESEGGVYRVRDENSAIHDGSVSLSATTGTLVTTGPVGTANTAYTQALSPVAYDHNYRVWWVNALNDLLELDFNVSGGNTIHHPVFRVGNLTSAPGTISLNGSDLIENTEYYLSYDASNQEAWITIVQDLTGNNTLTIGEASPITVTASLSSSTVVNCVDHTLTLSADVSHSGGGTITSVVADLSSIGGSANQAMSFVSGSTYTLDFTAGSSLSPGLYNIIVTATDNLSDQKATSVTLTVESTEVVQSSIYTDAATIISGTWGDQGTLTELTTGGSEGTDFYEFDYTINSGWAGFGLNLDQWGSGSPQDFSTADKIRFSYKGPQNGNSAYILFLNQGNVQSSNYTVPHSADWTTVDIPISAFTGVDVSQVTEIMFGMSGSGSGVFELDAIELIATNSCDTGSTDPVTGALIEADDANIMYTGRIDFSDPKAPSFSHPGIKIWTTFQGTSAYMIMEDEGSGTSTTTNYYNVIIDGGSPIVVEVNSQDTLYLLDSNLTNTSHTLEIHKRTESSVGKSTFKGLLLDDGQSTSTPEARPECKIEFIGNSITCGYGNEVTIDAPPAGDPNTGFNSINENNYIAYGSITARNLDMEYQAVAYSGRGVYRNNTGSTTGTLPEIYGRIFPDEVSGPAWSTSNYTPNVVVVNLGTNDFAPESTGNDLDSASFVQAYTDFVNTLRGYYSDAHIICAIGPMMNDYYPAGKEHLTRIRSYVSGMVDDFNNSGDSQVHFIEFDPQTEPYGEDWHPSAATHQSMATELTTFINSIYTCGVTTSIDDPSVNENDVIVYPNPATDLIHIRSTQSIEKVSISNSVGQVIMDVDSDNLNAIQVGNLNDGIYHLNITLTGGQSTVKRILILSHRW